MMLHYRQKLSLSYWMYAIATALAVSKLGTWYYSKTKPKMIDKHATQLERLWWRLYLLNYAYHASDEELMASEGEPVAVKWIQEYHFEYWNAFFHASCLSHVLYEVANGKKPFIRDVNGIWSSFFAQPVFDSDEPDSLPENTEKNCFFTSRGTPHNKLVTKIWCKMFRLYVRFSPSAEEYVEEECRRVLKQPEKTLGVICRGTDYIMLRPKKHPKQPSAEEVIKTVKKWIKKYGYTKIYVATEEETIFRKFEKEFPGMILSNKRSYYDKQMRKGNLTVISDVHFDRENDDYLKGIEYLSSLNILSKCDALIGGNCGGSTIAAFFNDGKYSRTKIFDRGIY